MTMHLREPAMWMLSETGEPVTLNLTDQPVCGSAVRARREGWGVSLRVAAAQIGISFNTLARLERGENVRYDAMVKALRWCR